MGPPISWNYTNYTRLGFGEEDCPGSFVDKFTLHVSLCLAPNLYPNSHPPRFVQFHDTHDTRYRSRNSLVFGGKDLEDQKLRYCRLR